MSKQNEFPDGTSSVVKFPTDGLNSVKNRLAAFKLNSINPLQITYNHITQPTAHA